MRIPEIIHFVWLNVRPGIPTENIATMVKWMLDNPGFKVFLWVDPKTCATTFSQLEQQYRHDFTEKYHDLNKSDRHDVDNFIVKDCRQEGVCAEVDNIVDYELGKIVPNYGASSDIVRYRALLKYGGSYFDFDVLPASNLKRSLAKLPDGHIFIADHLRQKNIASFTQADYDLFSYEWGDFGNDNMICTPNNPVMQSITDQVEKVNYHLTEDSDPMLIAARAYYSRNIREMTIAGAGPGVGRKLLPTIPVMEPFIEGDRRRGFTTEYHGVKSLVLPLKSAQHQLAKPFIEYGERTNVALYNARTWIRVDVNYAHFADFAAVEKSILSTIAVEQDNFKVCRLMDHYNDLLNAARYYQVDTTHAVNEFMEKVAGIIQPNKILAVQRINKIPVIEQFYQQFQLSGKTYFDDPVIAKHIVNWVMSHELLESESLRENNLMMTNPKLFENFLRDACRETESLMMLNKLIQGVAFIKFIKSEKISVFGYPNILFLDYLKTYQRILKQGEKVFREFLANDEFQNLQQDMESLIEEDYSYSSMIILKISARLKQVIGL